MSFHPHGCFSIEKIRENEKKMGACSKSLPNFNKNILNDFPRSLQSVVLGIIYHQNHKNYKITKSNKSLQRDNLGRKQKEETKSQKLAA